jgi:hypothetical protein
MDSHSGYCDLQNHWNILTAFNCFWYQFTTKPRRSVFHVFFKSQHFHVYFKALTSVSQTCTLHVPPPMSCAKWHSSPPCRRVALPGLIPSQPQTISYHCGRILVWPIPGYRYARKTYCKSMIWLVGRASEGLGLNWRRVLVCGTPGMSCPSLSRSCLGKSAFAQSPMSR